ncbi:MAG: arsenical pump family protein [Patescibacteria group bacterium]|nr:MAG: arsenical pump family protein [Patescibacteria group bacterium]
MINSINFLPFIFFVLLLIFIVTEKFNRSVITFVFSICFILFGFINYEEALKSIDFNTIGLLIGMMMIVSILSKTGIFQYLAIKTLKLAKGRPVRLLVLLSFLTAILSAFLDNVTTVLLIVPVTLYMTKILEISPFPLLMSIIFFSNIGGTATLIGDPPNIIIGSEANLSFNDFLKYNVPIVLIVSIFILIFLFLIFIRQLRSKKISINTLKKIKEDNLIKDKRQLIISIIILSIVFIGFITHSITHIENSVIALFGGFMLLLLTTKEPDSIYKEIEWTSIFFFIGLFILVSSLEKTGFLGFLSKYIIYLTKGNVELTSYLILIFVGIASGFVGSIPITIFFIKIIQELSLTGMNVFPLWWALSLGACFGANLTIIGSSANIVSVDIYKKQLMSDNNKKEQEINFKIFLKYGFIVTLISILLSILYLKFIFFNK